MRALVASCLVTVCACRFVGTQSVYGVSDHDQQFGEVGFILEDAEGSSFKSIPFVVAGAGRLPAAYGPGNESYQRLSIGEKLRFPIPIVKGRATVYLEGGAMVSYYEASAIEVPFEVEAVAGAGIQLDLGGGWWLDFAARAREPLGNGHRHDHPEHAPSDTQMEFAAGVRKDF